MLYALGLKKRNFASITNSLNKTVIDLEDLAVREEEEAKTKREKLKTLNEELECHDCEATKARKVAKNVSALLV